MLNKIKNLPLSTHLKIFMILTASGCVIGLISTEFSTGDLNFGMALGLILLIIGILWHIVFVRCPHCGHHFRFRASISNYCPDCGGKLE